MVTGKKQQNIWKILLPTYKSTNNMSHNPQHEPMKPWIIWAGVGMMIFTVLVFVLFTLGLIYWG
jgi:hypothetical protein